MKGETIKAFGGEGLIPISDILNLLAFFEFYVEQFHFYFVYAPEVTLLRVVLKTSISSAASPISSQGGLCVFFAFSMLNFKKDNF